MLSYPLNVVPKSRATTRASPEEEGASVPVRDWNHGHPGPAKLAEEVDEMKA